MSRPFTPEERLRNTNSSMFSGTLGGTVRAARPVRKSLTVPTGAIRSASTGISGVPTVFVAASNAPDAEKAMANYVCFGDASDTSVIQNAIWDDINSFGDYGRLILSHGDFYISALFLTNGLTFEGLGYDTVLHQLDSQAVNNTFLSPDSSFRETTIKNLRLDGNQDNQPIPTVAAGGQVGIAGYIGGGGSTTYEDIWAHDWSFAGIWPGINTTVTNCHVWDIGQDGLIADRPVYAGSGFEVTDSKVRFTHCSARHCQFAGFDMQGSRITLTACEATTCGYRGTSETDYAQSSYAGFSFAGQEITADGLYAYTNYHGINLNGGTGPITNSIIENSTGNGMFISSSHYGSISHNKFVNAAKHGVYGLSCSHTLFEDNLFDSNGGASTHDNIHLAYDGSNPGTDNTIINNVFTSGPRYHVNIANANISNTWVGMNNLRAGAGTARINNAGTATITNPGNWGIDF